MIYQNVRTVDCLLLADFRVLFVFGQRLNLRLERPALDGYGDAVLHILGQQDIPGALLYSRFGLQNGPKPRRNWVDDLFV